MDSDDDLSPFFPPELEREIFETTAELYPQSIGHLLLVAHRVHEWIEKIKYNTVSTLDHPSSCSLRALQQAIHSNVKQADFFHDRVRHLFVDEEEDEVGLRELLSVCSGTRSVVLLRPYKEQSILPSLTLMKPRRLSAHSASLFGPLQPLDPIPMHPMLTYVTHLDLFDDTSDLPHIRWSNLALFPALTHLALLHCNSSLGTELLSTNAKLAVLISMLSSGFLPENRISNDDVRFVRMSVLDEDYGLDWLTGVKGGVDFWARADLFVAKKRRGEIKPDSRCWIEPADGI
ncbi:hypothetical protein DFH09DRAFT_971686 [Mycena vulgaris]|nr:hypothetical protein DFH09DRAFT_971686 [Mycena vulgaris]